MNAQSRTSAIGVVCLAMNWNVEGRVSVNKGGCSCIVLCNKEYQMNKEYKEKILKTGLEGFLIGIAIGVAVGIVYFFTH